LKREKLPVEGESRRPPLGSALTAQRISWIGASITGTSIFFTS